MLWLGAMTGERCWTLVYAAATMVAMIMSRHYYTMHVVVSCMLSVCVAVLV